MEKPCKETKENCPDQFLGRAGCAGGVNLSRRELLGKISIFVG
jgi:hypothetical protein